MGEGIVTFFIITVLSSLIIPFPPWIIDCFLISNIVLASILFFRALYISDPLKLSTFPGILLLAAIYRLILNISTTRLILSGGEGSRVIEVLGKLIINDNILVGAVTFIIITLIQFIVIAKGAERIAEVSARFTLDALPGKQMSIDADLRSGLIDVETANIKRETLQIESKFYGALDGSIKFIKGDAISGLVIIVINILGGFIIGLLLQNLSLAQAVSKFSTLTIGDGLISQIPALLNSLAAGMIVTRVGTKEHKTFIFELVQQISQMPFLRFIIAIILLVVSLVPDLPFIPFFILGIIMLASIPRTENNLNIEEEVKEEFKPGVIPYILIKYPIEHKERFVNEFKNSIEGIKKNIYDNLGIIIQTPQIDFVKGKVVKLYIKGSLINSFKLISDGNKLLKQIKDNLLCHADLLIDSQTIKRNIELIGEGYEDLIRELIPEKIKLGELASILKQLAEEGISIKNFLLILQKIFESQEIVSDKRKLLAEIRVALKRSISNKYSHNDQIQVISISPDIDKRFVESEIMKKEVSLNDLEKIVNKIESHNKIEFILLSSKISRRLIRECLILRSIDVPILAYEELTSNLNIKVIDEII